MKAKLEQKKMSEAPAERPPVVVVMGHIDHGKSTLLDYIRKTNVTVQETGGITQHIGAYEAVHKDAEGKEHHITFLDTPGHAAFAGIRSRGASVADVAILVVSAEDGVKPQTLEALACIKKCAIPFIVAINKIDKPNADVERTKNNLAENEIYIEGYGGDVPWTAISAKTGEGIGELLDLVLLAANIRGLKSESTKAVLGIIIEVNHDAKRGSSATAIIKEGTLKKSDFVIAENAYSSLRTMENFRAEPLGEAQPGQPVRIIGWHGEPQIGAELKTAKTKKEAEKLAESFLEKIKKAPTPAGTGSESQPESVGKGTATVAVIIKADVAGSLEAIEHELEKIKEEKLKIKILAGGVGEITEGDIKLAATGAITERAIIIGFNVKIDTNAKAAAERLGVQVEFFDIIYKLSEWLEIFIATRRPKVTTEEMTGRAKILKIFSQNKDKQIIGGRVEEGALSPGAIVKILRREAEIGRGKIRGLQQQKNAIQEAKKDTEFGALVEAKIEIATGDRLEAFTLTTK
ncbi:MAG: translation initiation factor IF-2 [Patescibacteria group bacterium]